MTIAELYQKHVPEAIDTMGEIRQCIAGRNALAVMIAMATVIDEMEQDAGVDGAFHDEIMKLLRARRSKEDKFRVLKG